MDLSNLRHLKSPRDILLLSEVFFSLLYLKVLLGKMPIRDLLDRLSGGKGGEVDEDRLEKMVRFANFVLHRVFRTKSPCAPRSLLLFRYLKPRGDDVRIVFGVKDGEGDLEGHAWLLRRGVHFPEEEDHGDQYREVFTYP